MTMLITGANRGVGLALAQRAAAHGQSVIGTYRGPMPPEATGVEWQRLEVADPASQQILAKRLLGRPLALLVCNAGVYIDRSESLDSGYAKRLWDETFAVNVTGVFLTIQALLPNLRAAIGKVAIISSQMASHTRASGGSYIYRASKAAALKSWAQSRCGSQGRWDCGRHLSSGLGSNRYGRSGCCHQCQRSRRWPDGAIRRT